jgi:hypothetical protein
MALAAPVSCTHSYTGTTLTDPALALPLRANGTDLESLYRQMLSQFLHPLTADNKVRACLCFMLFYCVVCTVRVFLWSRQREVGCCELRRCSRPSYDCFSLWAWNAAYCPPKCSSIVFLFRPD